MTEYHVGRGWSGTRIEDECPCPKESCGLVCVSNVDPDCEQHKVTKTIRQGHSSDECPGLKL